MATKLIIAFALAVWTGGAHAGVLYKSIDRDGHTTFSDMPIDGAVTMQRIDTSESAKPAVGAGNAPIYLALAETGDEAIARANARVDMAEHALAIARQSIFGENDPLALSTGRASRADLQRLESYHRDLRAARKDLMRALQTRNALSPRPVA